jgi:hypothetical protein
LVINVKYICKLVCLNMNNNSPTVFTVRNLCRYAPVYVNRFVVRFPFLLSAANILVNSAYKSFCLLDSYIFVFLFNMSQLVYCPDPLPN